MKQPNETIQDLIEFSAVKLITPDAIDSIIAMCESNCENAKQGMQLALERRSYRMKELVDGAIPNQIEMIIDNDVQIKWYNKVYYTCQCYDPDLSKMNNADCEKLLDNRNSNDIAQQKTIVAYADYRAIQRFFKMRPNIDLNAGFGSYTQRAVSEGRDDVFKLLVENGANPKLGALKFLTENENLLETIKNAQEKFDNDHNKNQPETYKI